LTPSPRNRDNLSDALWRSTTAAFLSGSTSASTISMLRRRATAPAVVRLSPVSVTTRMPSAQGSERVVCRGLGPVGDDAYDPAIVAGKDDSGAAPPRVIRPQHLRRHIPRRA